MFGLVCRPSRLVICSATSSSDLLFLNSLATLLKSTGVHAKPLRLISTHVPLFRGQIEISRKFFHRPAGRSPWKYCMQADHRHNTGRVTPSHTVSDLDYVRKIHSSSTLSQVNVNFDTHEREYSWESMSLYVTRRWALAISLQCSTTCCQRLVNIEYYALLGGEAVMYISNACVHCSDFHRSYPDGSRPIFTTLRSTSQTGGCWTAIVSRNEYCAGIFFLAHTLLNQKAKPIGDLQPQVALSFLDVACLESTLTFLPP